MEELNKLYEMYSKQIYKYLLFLTGDSNLAEDMLQETFYQAFKSIYRFKGDSKVSTWLYQIAKHVYFKYTKKQSFKKTVYIEEESTIADYRTPETISMEKHRNDELLRIIRKLKEPYNKIITLRTFSYLSFKEIGEILDRSEGWARTMYYRGKLKLKELLIKNKWEG